MKEYRLGDLIDIKHGYAFDGEHIVQEDNGIVLVTPGNFRIGGGFQEEKCKFFNGEIPSDYILSAGDYIVTMTDLSKKIDTLGYSAIVPNSDRTYLHNQRIGLISFKNDECYPGYIYFLMRTHLYQRSIANTSTGATVHHTSPAKIYDYRFTAPDYVTQRKIADYLFSYEKLIDNNQKQIKLLEEAAQRLYKEWFVDLRFPGHENTPVIDGVPQGWEEYAIAELCERINAGGTPSRRNKNYWDNATIKWYKTQELQDCWLIDSDEKISVEGQSNSSAKFFPKNTILMAIYASPTLGRLGILDSEATCNQAALCLKADETKISWQWLHEKLYELRDHYNGIARGAGQQNISGEVVKQTIVLCPTKRIMDKYTQIVAPLFEKRRMLQKQNIRLTEARDRLLPKLMSGESEV